MSSQYVELHTHSFYSFGEGASHVHELIAAAKEKRYRALALTDTNLCGALDFARTASSLDIQPVTGGEITFNDGSHITLLAKSRNGYANLSRLFTYAGMADRTDPKLDGEQLAQHAEGLILLTGCRNGKISNLLAKGRCEEAKQALKEYTERFGSDSVYVELQQNRINGDTERNRRLVQVAKETGAPVAATNNVHYHSPERHRLQNVLTAIKNNSTLDRALHLIKPSNQFYLKSQQDMERLFGEIPEAIFNTNAIAEKCTFNLGKDLGYRLPSPPVPEGYTPETYLRQLCYEAAFRRYGGTTPDKVKDRLEEEFRLIGKHGLAGFLLLYRELVNIARDIMIEDGIISPETPVEWKLPGRGRGSSVALLVGYLIGISHVDPLLYDLTLERFLPEDAKSLPDIDLDFPRELREKLIERIHRRYGHEHAVLTGAIATYQISGIIADVGKALGLPQEDLKRLSDSIHSHDPENLKEEMSQLPEFRDRVDLPGWRDLISLAPQLMEAPKGLGQHVGGMILSSSPIPEMVPVREGAIKGRYIMDWDKDSIADGGFAKIDILSLPVLDQMDQAVDLIEKRTGKRIDLTRIPPEDSAVYNMINEGRSVGIFLLQSPAQLKMGQRLKSRNLVDLAYQVALIRPGVGVQGSAVSQFVERYRHGALWEYDHPLEKRALERGCGIIVWQEQVVQLITDVSGMSSAEADQMRRAFSKKNNKHLIEMYREKFTEGARAKGVPEKTIEKIFGKINGQYMFPESHSYSFAVSAYQAAWLKRYYPVEFFTFLMNNQPMGFYPLEALKEDAKRFDVTFLNPCINRSEERCTAEGNSVRIGLEFVKNVGSESAKAIAEERTARGKYGSVGDLLQRVSLKPETAASLVMAGAFDGLVSSRKQALWEAGLYFGPKALQKVLPVSFDHDVPELKDFTPYEKALAEYRVMGMFPGGHLMEFVRPMLPKSVATAKRAESAKDGEILTVAGWPVARQHPKGEDGTVFITVEDETGDMQLILWSRVFQEHRREVNGYIIMAKGTVSRWDGTANLIVSSVKKVPLPWQLPRSHDWH